MKKQVVMILVLASALFGAAAYADEAVMLPIAEALAAKDAQETLDDSIKLYFGNQKHPKVLTKLGSDVANKKTNGFGKSAENACNWVFLSAVKQMQQRAQRLGANAIINIVSYYRKDEVSNPTEFECHKNAFVASVALKGDFVKIAKK